jgi:Cu+-exporting ATPase
MPHFLHGVRNSLHFALIQAFFAIAIAFINRDYFYKGFKGLFKGTPSMDSLIAIGAGASIIYGLYAAAHIWHCLLSGDLVLVASFSMDLYFESAGTILTLITTGKYLESRSKKKTGQAVEKLINLSPKTALIEKDAAEYEIDVKDVKCGDTLIVKAGSSIAVDGIIIQGGASIDESSMTGESLPVDKSAGETVFAGTISRSGYFKMKVLKVGGDTVLSKIIGLVETAGEGKPEIARLADKVSAVFTPSIILAAAITAAVWLISGASAEFSLSCAIAVLVISCPCALGLATPVAITVAAGRGAQNGILFKNAEVIETLNKTTTVVFDKTGTLTQGKPSVSKIYPYEKFDVKILLRLAACAENFSSHPLARAIMEKAKYENIEIVCASGFNQYDGGIEASVEGKNILAGNEKFMEDRGVITGYPPQEAKVSFENGEIPIYFAVDGKIAGIIFAKDNIKESSAQAVKEMKELGLKTVLLTGDNEITAKTVAKQSGIDVALWRVFPDEKEKIINDLQNKGETVLMAGDGVNDAPALARADIGAAVGAGTDIAIESSDMVLAKNDLRDIVKAFKLSKAAIRNIKQNLFWAFFYNVICIPLAAGVLYPFFHLKLNPMFAAAAMSLSSLFVVTNALRLKKIKI